MKLSAVIMAHPVRKDSAERVRASLDRDVEIVYDQVTQPSADPRQRWAVGRRCWQAADPSADWHLVIQDDALVCQDLLAGLEKALDVIGPEGLVSAYTGTGRPDQYNVRRAHRHAQDKGHSWMPTKSLCWGVAILAPVPTIPDMVKWCDRKAGMPDDMRVGKWFQSQKIDTWYTWPSLVDHRLAPSLTKPRQVERVAVRHHQGSALELDWSGPTVMDPMIWTR